MHMFAIGSAQTLAMGLIEQLWKSLKAKAGAVFENTVSFTKILKNVLGLICSI